MISQNKPSRVVLIPLLPISGDIGDGLLATGSPHYHQKYQNLAIVPRKLSLRRSFGGPSVNWLVFWPCFFPHTMCQNGDQHLFYPILGGWTSINTSYSCLQVLIHLPALEPLAGLQSKGGLSLVPLSAATVDAVDLGSGGRFLGLDDFDIFWTCLNHSKMTRGNLQTGIIAAFLGPTGGGLHDFLLRLCPRWSYPLLWRGASDGGSV